MVDRDASLRAKISNFSDRLVKEIAYVDHFGNTV
jgi:hypothetical protein